MPSRQKCGQEGHEQVESDTACLNKDLKLAPAFNDDKPPQIANVPRCQSIPQGCQAGVVAKEVIQEANLRQV